MSNSLSQQITDSMLDLSVEVILYVETASRNKAIVDQITRAVTSVGANYTEAQDASSKKDLYCQERSGGNSLLAQVASAAQWALGQK